MTTTYTYSVAGDFTAGVNVEQLQNEILAEAGITETLLGVSTDGIDVFVTYNAALSAGEIILLDAVIAAHIPGTGPQPAPATGSLVNIITVTNKTTPISTEYKEIARRVWNSNRYTNFNNGIVIYKTTITGSPIDIRVWDETAGAELGQYTSSSTENNTFTIDTPESDTIIILYIRRTTYLGATPVLNSITVEYTN